LVQLTFRRNLCCSEVAIRSQYDHSTQCV
jgi:hypothetical protein